MGEHRTVVTGRRLLRPFIAQRARCACLLVDLTSTSYAATAYMPCASSICRCHEVFKLPCVCTESCAEARAQSVKPLKLHKSESVTVCSSLWPLVGMVLGPAVDQLQSIECAGMQTKV